jgi:hypothetical protein
MASTGISGSVKSCRGEKQITRHVPETGSPHNSPLSPPEGEGLLLGSIAAKSFVKT